MKTGRQQTGCQGQSDREQVEVRGISTEGMTAERGTDEQIRHSLSCLQPTQEIHTANTASRLTQPP